MPINVILIALLSSPGGARADDWVDQGARPAYEALETVSDGMYSILRNQVFTTILPRRLGSELGTRPTESSYSDFQAEWHRKQIRALRRTYDSRPLQPTSSPSELVQWRRKAIHEQTIALSDAFVETLLARYQIRRFGKSSNSYASNIQNWDADFFTSAVLFGGAYAYVAGVRTSININALRFELDLSPGRALQSAFQTGNNQKISEIRLSRRGSPWTLKSRLRLQQGHLIGDNLGIHFTQRF